MRKTANDHKQDLIDGLIAARASVLVEAGKLPPEQLEAPCIGIWCVKDLIAHLVGWDFTNLQAVQEILEGMRPSFFQYYDPDWRSYNARLVNMYRIEPFETLMCTVADSHLKFVTFLKALPAEDILLKKSPKEQGRTITIRNLLRTETKDECNHSAQVQAFRAKALP